MTDIRTVETIVVDDEYRVRVAKLEDEDGFEAAVVATKMTPLGKAMSTMFLSSDAEWSPDLDAPRVTGTDRYETVGRAVDVYLEWLLSEGLSDAKELAEEHQ